MSLKNGNTVAVERRMDLASLFCMIGRHGPAVAVAVIAMVSVLAGFIIYRTLKGKRRKATAAAAHTDGQTPPGAEGDASVIQPSPEESHSSLMATGLGYEGSLDVKEDFDLIQSDHIIRHRSAAAAAAEKQPSSYSSMKDIQEPENKHPSSDDTVEMAVMRDSYRVADTYPEVVSQSLQSDTYTDAEMVVEEAVDCYYSATNDTIEDVIEEVHDVSSCLMEPDVIYEENSEDEHKVLKAECQEDEVVTTYEDASDGKTRQDEEINHTSENDDVEGLHVNESSLTCSQTETNSVGSNMEDPDVPVPCVCNVKDEEFEEEKTESVACSNISIHHLSTEDQKKAECEEAEEECEDYRLIPQQAVIHSSTFEEEANLLWTNQDQSDHTMDEGILPIQDSAEVTDEDCMNDLTAVDMHTAQSNERDVEIEQNEDNGSTCSQEVDVLYDKDNEVKEENLASDEECESLSVETSPALPCLSVPTSAENIDDCVSDITTDDKDKTSGISDSPDFSSDSKETLKEDEIDPSLTEDTDSTILGSQMPSHDTGNENNERDPTVLSPEECTDSVYEPDVQSYIRDQQSVEMIQNEDLTEAAVLHSVACDGENITSPVMAEDVPLPYVPSCNSEQHTVEIVNNEMLDKGSVADVDTVEKVTSSETLEETFPYMPSICHDQESDYIEDHNLDLTGVSYGSDTPACDHVCPTALLMGEETSTPDMLSSFQDQQSDHMRNSEDFDETGVDTPACNDANLSSFSVAEGMSFPDVLPPSQDQQSDHNGNSETFDEIVVTTPACIEASLTEPLMPEVKSHPNMMPSSQDQSGDSMEHTETLDTLRDNSDVLAFDQASIKSTITSEDISHTDMMSSFQHMLSNPVENYEDFPEGSILAAPVMTANSSPPVCPIYFPSLKQSELGDNDLSSPGVGKESGISSMAVSPDLQDAGNVFDVTVENIVVPVMDYDSASSAEIESKYSCFSDDVAVSYKNENTAGMIFGPYPSHPQLPHSEQMDWMNYESFAANEDMFGLEIEDSYHREMDQFMAQIVDSVTSLADELKEETDTKAVVEVAEIKEKEARVGVGKKEDTKAEEEEAMDFDKTGISIMEATMDNNEWITDSNYQVLPWMNLSAQSISQDHTKPNQLSTEESSAECDVSYIVTTDKPSATEVKQTGDLSLLDENSENSKKVLAVQPMPQNVNVTFRVHYCTQSPYQTMAVTGDQQELGNWKGFIPLERAKDGHWATVVSLPAECHVQWKFVLLNKGEVSRWEECGNRFLETGSGDDLLVHKWWGLL
ncbi:titin homolog [Labrus bergylta]|uniref:Starch-binding domain-containing protein 1 n=1 Tax=Labrus bergylta TaxID=56723 RepID=A0A3Q3G5S9_9LABR|nr:starch-binding domain-containing protein 1 [Labrus bergylta]